MLKMTSKMTSKMMSTMLKMKMLAKHQLRVRENDTPIESQKIATIESQKVATIDSQMKPEGNVNKGLTNNIRKLKIYI